MTKTYKTVELDIIKPYKRNPRFNDGAVDDVVKSIKQCGYIAPIILDENMEILAGHTRFKALKCLRRKTADVVIVEGLTDEQKRKYRLLDNKTNELSEWDIDKLTEELDGLDFDDLDLEWFDSSFEDSIENAKKNGIKDEDYQEFEDKFKPKLTTDDCYTPPPVYEAVKDWAVKEYGWEGRPIVRPFYPNGDYQHEKYPKNCVVIDNPPFSIFSQIVRWYNDQNIDYFLFAPHLTMFESKTNASHICVGAQITYENGAVVRTSFVCSKGPLIRSAPDLFNLIERVDEETRENNEFIKYQYPDNVVTAPMISQFSKYGIDYAEDDGYFIRRLDSQKDSKKNIYGGGFLVPSENITKTKNRFAKEQPKRLAEEQERLAERQQQRLAEHRQVWELSDREKEIVKELDKKATEKEDDVIWEGH